MDPEDRALHDLLGAPDIADDGFSGRVMQRIERRSRLRRWLLPGATLAGGLLAAAPASRLLVWLGESLTPAASGMALSNGVLESSLLGLLLCGAAVAALRLLEP